MTETEEGFWVQLKAGEHETPAFIDSGCNVELIDPSVLSQVMEKVDVLVLKEPGRLRMGNGTYSQTYGRVILPVGTTNGKRKVMTEFIIASVGMPLVIGKNFIKRNGCVMNGKKMTFSIDGDETTDDMHCPAAMPQFYKIKVAEAVVIPPRCEMIVPGRVEGKANFTAGIVEERERPICNGDIALSKMLVNPTKPMVPLRVANLSSEPQRLYKDMVVGTCEEVEGVSDPVNLGNEDDDEESEDEGGEDGKVEIPIRSKTHLRLRQKLRGKESEEELPEHVRGVAEEFEERLTPEQNAKARDLLFNYKDQFNESKRKLSSTNKVKHTMTMKSDRIVKLRPRRVPLAKLPALKNELDDMIEAGVIEPSCSAWASPIVTADKKDGSLRVCVDYREVNDLTVKDSYPLPRIDDSLDALSGAKWFSTLDLRSGYWQVKMDPKDKEKTAFTSPYGLYQFTTMPFGLANAPSTFQRLMDLVLAGLHWEACLIYLDDVIVFGRTFEEHLERLRSVLERFKEANLQLNPSKCHLFQSQVECLGFIVSANGVATDPEKTKAVRDWPTPRSASDVRSFIGLCSYYRRFVKGFATIAAPLYRLTQKGVDFEWAPDCEAAFNELKDALMTAPVLAYPRSEGEFILDTDASDVGIGSVISQMQDGVERVIAYFSRSLGPVQRRYCVTRRELLAIVESVKYFHHYLYGRHFLIRSDHSSLQWLLRFKNPEGQLARWLTLLFTYDWEVKHRPGKDHGNADALSRRPCVDCKQCERKELKDAEGDKGCPGHVMRTMRKVPDDVDDKEGPGMDQPWLNSPWTEENLQKWQEEERPLKLVREWMAKGKKPAWRDIRPECPKTKVLWSCFETLALVNGVLFKKTEKDQALKLVAPSCIQDQIFEFLHSGALGGHFGVKRTDASVRQRFWWPGIKPDVARWVKYCDLCQRKTSRAGGRRGLLRQDRVGYPMERIAMDILSLPDATEQGNTCVLVVSDYFSKWSEAIALPCHTAEVVAEALVTQLFLRFGVSRFLHSDKGAEFMSDLIVEICRLLDINKTFTCPYRPQSDGLVERLNQTLIAMLCKLVNEKRDDWDVHLPYMMAAYRASVNESTLCSPNLLMLGREVCFPVDLMFPSPQTRGYKCHVEYVHFVRRAMREAHERAREHMEVAACRQKRTYDGHAKDQEFKVGEWVLRFYTPNRNSKLAYPYVGPYLVVKRVSEVTYSLQQHPDDAPLTVHADHLKRYYAAKPRPNWLVEAEAADTDEVTGVEAEAAEAEGSVAGTEDEKVEEEECTDGGKRKRQLPTRFKDYVL